MDAGSALYRAVFLLCRSIKHPSCQSAGGHLYIPSHKRLRIKGDDFLKIQRWQLLRLVFPKIEVFVITLCP